MNEYHLLKAQKEWSHAMDITLENGKIHIANDGWISDNINDFKEGKHFGKCGSFVYFSKRKGNLNVIKNVISYLEEAEA